MKREEASELDALQETGVAEPEILAMGQILVGSEFQVALMVRFVGRKIRVVLSKAHSKKIGLPIGNRGGLT
jgi:hypothetical protein